ncbi:lysozyme inhibitor LprI family protein [soil metagenome]
MTTLRPAALVVALLVAPGPAAAQDAEAALGPLRACLDFADSRADAAACAGAHARGCMEAKAEGQTTIGMTFCAMEEAAAWDLILNETWGELVLISRRRAILDDEAGEVPAPLEDMLREAQRAWLAFRDADCAHEYAVWGLGSMRQIAGARCVLDRTAQRVIELREKRDMMEIE